MQGYLILKKRVYCPVCSKDIVENGEDIKTPKGVYKKAIVDNSNNFYDCQKCLDIERKYNRDKTILTSKTVFIKYDNSLVGKLGVI